MEARIKNLLGARGLFHMSGHNKWSTIKRKKGAEDAKRGKIFTRLGRDITLAVREGNGIGDPEMNARLRVAIDRAKASSMPKENIDRAIKRGTGELKGEEPEEITYEGYAAHGVAILVKCLTDNRNRTLSDVRRAFNRAGGSMAEAGAVSWMFEVKGDITMDAGQMPADDLFMLAVDAGADDVIMGDEMDEILTPPDELHKVREVLQAHHLKIEDAELSQIPKNQIDIETKDALTVLHMIEALEELDDVQQVYSTLNVTDEMLKELEEA
jgi:YebC/PmpR family DNA-binding regulatory protein